MVTVAPYGSWLSPITTELITGRRVSVSTPASTARMSTGWSPARMKVAAPWWCAVARMAASSTPSRRRSTPARGSTSMAVARTPSVTAC